MIQTIIKTIVPLVCMLGVVQAHAESIRYAYCISDFKTLSSGPGSYKVSQGDRIILFSPVFKVDVSNPETSRLELVTKFEQAVFAERNKPNSRLGNWMADIPLDHNRCNLDPTSLDEAKEQFDRDYMKVKNLVPYFERKCSMIGTYQWTPNGLEGLYATKVTTLNGTNVSTQSCDSDEGPLYK